MLGLLAAAAALWVSSRLAWSVEVPAAGVARRLTGAQAQPALGPFALLALAAVAAAVAAGPLLRRLLGAVLATAGAWLAWLGVQALAERPAAGPDVPELQVLTARALVVVAGAVLLAVGVLLLLRAGRMPRLGARFSAPTTRLGPGAGRSRGSRELWDALDAGSDPTIDPR